MPFFLDAIIAFQVQPCRQVRRQHLVQIRCDALHLSLIHISARPFLYGADGEQQVQRLLAPLGVAQPRHSVVARVERQDVYKRQEGGGTETTEIRTFRS